jgi:hypothetical protein
MTARGDHRLVSRESACAIGIDLYRPGTCEPIVAGRSWRRRSTLDDPPLAHALVD